MSDIVSEHEPEFWRCKTEEEWKRAWAAWELGLESTIYSIAQNSAQPCRQLGLSALNTARKLMLAGCSSTAPAEK